MSNIILHHKIIIWKHPYKSKVIPEQLYYQLVHPQVEKEARNLLSIIQYKYGILCWIENRSVYSYKKAGYIKKDIVTAVDYVRETQ